VSNAIEIVVSSKDDTGTGFKSATKGSKDLGESFDAAGERADKAEQRVMGFRDTITGLQDTTRGLRSLTMSSSEAQDKYNQAVEKYGKNSRQAQQAAQNLADTQQTLGDKLLTVGMGLGDFASGLANLLIPALGGLVKGAKGAAGAVKAFTVSLLTNPVFLIGAAIAALVVGLVVLYKKSDTARNIMNTAFAGIGVAVLTMAQVGLKGFQFLVNAALSAAGALLNVAAKIPGPQQEAMKKAAAAFNGFKDSVNSNMDAASRKLDQWKGDLARMPKVAKLNGDITDLSEKLAAAKAKLGDKKLTATQTAAVKADIRQLEQKIASAKAQLATIKGKTVTITYKSNGIIRTQDANVIGSAGRSHTGGTLRGFAGGGNPPPGMSWVGETGPELLSLSGGTARITPSGNSRRMAQQYAGGGGGQAPIVFHVPSGGSALDQLFLNWLKNVIRGQGGDVQVVLGS
jgi:predicted  nucleic acid-binding Zn-ribbon protein